MRSFTVAALGKSMKWFVMASILLLLCGQSAVAATRQWVGGTSTSWNVAGNWSPSGIPAAGDAVLFTGTPTRNCLIDVSTASLASLTMDSTYTGTVTMNTGFTVTVTGALSVGAGTFTGNASAISAASLSITGGSFTSTSGTLTLSGAGGFTHYGGTFSNNGGTVTFTGTPTVTVTTATTFNTVNFSGSGSGSITGAGGLTAATANFTAGTIAQSATTPITVTGTLTVSGGTFSGGSGAISVGTLSITSGTFTSTSGTLTVTGNFTHNGGTFTHNSGTVTFTGTPTVTVTTATVFSTVNFSGSGSGSITGAGGLTAATASFTAGTIAQSTTTPIAVTGTLTVSGGTFSGGSGAVSVGTLSITSGTFTSTSGTLTVTGNFTNNGGTFTHNNGTVTFTGSSPTLSLPTATTFYNVNFGGSGTATLPNGLTAHDITINSGTVSLASSATLTYNGTFTVNTGGTFTSASSSGVTGSAPGGAFIVAGGTFNSAANATFTVTSLAVSAGTFNVAGSTTPNINGDLTVSGTGTFNDAGSTTVTVTGGNLTVSGTGKFVGGSGSNQFIRVTNSSTNSMNISGGTFTASTGSGSTITVSGDMNISNGGTFTGPTSSGTAIQVTGALTVQDNNSSFGVNWGTGTTFTAGSITVSGGTLSANTGTNAGTLTVGGGTGTIGLSGGQFIQGCAESLSAGVMTLSGGNYLNCNSSSGGTGTLGLAGITVSSSSSTFDYVGTGTITLTGNVSNSGTVRINGGTLACGSGQSQVLITASAVRTWNTSAGRYLLADVNLVDQVASTKTTIYGNSTIGTGSGTDGNNWHVDSTCAGGTGVGSAPTLVRFHSFAATPQDGGVLLRWRSGREVDNLGFHVYRDGVRVTPSPIAGSALMVGARTMLTAGNSYGWFDPEGTTSSTYTIEDLDLSGVRAVNGPFGVGPATAATSGTTRTEHTRSRLIGELGRPGSSSRRWFSTHAESESTADVMPAANAVPQANALGAATPTAAAATTPAQTSQQYALASGQAVKLGVQQEGWYHVDAGQLTAAGMPAHVNPSSLRLFVNGQEQDILVLQQKSQVTAIEFYATGVDTPWSDTQSYWLTWGAQVGQRIQSASARANGVAPASFPFTVQWKPRMVYFSALNNGDADNFFGPVLHPTDQLTQTLPVTNLDVGASGSSTLQVRMQGVTAGTHVVMVDLSGTTLGSVTFENQDSGVASFTVSTASLSAGANLTLTAKGLGNDVTVVDTVTLTYPHLYAADGDVLRCTASSGQRVVITGFDNSQIRVMDITDPANVTAPQGTVARQSDGSYGITVVAPNGGTRTLLAFTAGQMSQPASMEANQPSSWHSKQAGADLVIVSHGDFIDSLAPLVALRQAQGLKVAVVNVEDLYDEFNFGVLSPYAVKTFLATANTVWKTKPRWVLLVGDATFDPRGYSGVDLVNYVPVEMVWTTQFETASDDWFVDFDLDGIPDLAIGRLPVHAVGDAAALVAKIVAYDQAKGAAWKNNALLVAGVNDDDDDFEGNIAAVKKLLPAKMNVTQILQASDSDPAGDFLAAFNSGQGLVNFTGHGSNEVWDGDLFTSAAAAGLANGAATPFVISMTCLNGFFPDVYTFSLAEAVLEAPAGGAVGVWASSGMTESAPQATLNQAMITALYGGGSITVGEAAVAAKKAVSDSDVRRTWILFGDPAMKLR